MARGDRRFLAFTVFGIDTEWPNFAQMLSLRQDLGGGRMKQWLIIIGLTGTLAACNAYDPRDRAVAGGLIGAGTGAVVGGLATGRVGGAVAGGVIGAAGGALIGAATTPRPYYYRRWCRGYDAYGYPVRYRC
jgi:osmotically inducible lipoprotein OsmB